MDSLGDFLYLIFIVGALVYSIVKKTNNSKSETPPLIHPTERKENQKEKTDIFYKLSQMFEEPSSPPVKQEEQVPKTNTTYKKESFLDKQNSRKDKIVAKKKVTQESSFSFKHNDLKKAVIYSEILKRPEY